MINMPYYTFNRQYDIPTVGPSAIDDQRDDIIMTIGFGLYVIGSIVEGIKTIKNERKNK